MKRKRHYYQITLLLIFIIIQNVVAQAQMDRRTFLFSNLGTHNGLSNARISSIVEAKDGAMWFSSKRGVDRYNGYVVKNYDLFRGSKFSDASGRTVQLISDANRNIYAYDNKGKIFQYNEALDRYVMRYDVQKMIPEVVVLSKVIIDDKGSVWVGMVDGLYRIDSSGKGHWIYKKKNVYINDLTFVDKKASQLMISTNNGIYLYDVRRGKIKSVIKNISVQTSFLDKATGKVWLGTFSDGVKVYDTRTWKQKSTPAFGNLPHIPVRSIEPYDATTMLFGIDGAGVYAARKDGTAVWLLFNADDKTGNVLHGNGIYDICKDTFGDIWICSYSGGVDIATPIGHLMEIVQHEYLNTQSLVNSCCNDVFENGDFIWYATDRGVSVYNKTTSTWHHALFDKVALTICKAEGNDVLVGTYGSGVYRVSPNGASREEYSRGNGKLKTDYVFSLFVDRGGDTWIGCLDGPMVRIHQGTLTYYDIRQVQTITDMPDGRVAVGTTNGVYAVDKRTGRISEFFTSKEMGGTDVNLFVQTVLFTRPGEAWIATDGGGIYIYDYNKHKISNINTQQGLPSNTVYAIGMDRYNRVFAATDIGLAYIPVGERKVVNINYINGLEREYKRMSICNMRNGNFIFGSSSGAVFINPQQIGRLVYKSRLRITAIDVQGIAGDDVDEWLTEIHGMIGSGKVYLDHDQNTFDIVFESINYKYQHDIAYQYKLDGYDKQWSAPRTLQSAHYTNLPPGSYTFRVRCISRSDNKVIDEREISITVCEPWWNTWLAWIFYLAILAYIINIVWHYYRQKMEQHYFDEKINFFVNTAHDIRTPLSLVLAPLNDIADDDSLSDSARNYLEIARRNGNKLLNMVTQLLDFQKADRNVSNMSVRQFDLRQLLVGQLDKFALLAEQKHIVLTLAECPDGAQVWMDSDMADKIFENILSNAMKYTPDGGRVEVTASLDSSGMINVDVADTGIGIPKKAQKNIFQNFYRADNAINSKETGSGLGLMLAQRLIGMHHGTLTFDSKENEGTTFHIHLRGGFEHLRDSIANNVSNDMKRNVDGKAVAKTDYPSRNDDEGDGNNKDTLLFVDDNAELREYITMTFRNIYNVVTVESGEDALEYLQHDVCDIVVSDVMMPGIDGDELCRQIKENPETSWLPVILLTAKSGRDFVIEGLEKGADDYIVKPFDVAILKTKISSVLANHRRLSRYYMQQSMDIAHNTDANTDFQPSSVTQEAPHDVAGSVAEDSAQENDVVMNEADREFVDKATRLVLDNLKNTDFNIDQLCQEMAMSRTLFYGRLKKLTSQTPQDFIRIIRLERAAALLQEGRSVLDVSVLTGFVNVKHFSTIFKRYFGVSPSKFK